MAVSTPEISDRIVVIRNPASSHAAKVQDEVMAPYHDIGLSACQLVEFPVPSTNVLVSTERLAEALEPGDRLISPAGDGTGNLAVNAAILAGGEGIRIGFLPYGNFNDMAATFTSRRARSNPVTLLTSPDIVEARPLRVMKDGEHHRYALLYANLGWTAQAAAMYDDPEVRNALQAGEAGLASNMVRLARSYFAERSNATLPVFRMNGEPEVHTSTTDFLAINGPIMGKIIRSTQPYYGTDQFLGSELDVSRLLRNVGFLGRSALNLCVKTHFKLPGHEVSRAELDFGDLVSVPLQLDGEYELARVHSLTISKEHPEGVRGVNIIAA